MRCQGEWCSAQFTLSVLFCRGLDQGTLVYRSCFFGLLMASRKLRHYFQAHEITVVTRFPLNRILQNPEATGRIVEWALELSSFGLKFESTSTIQSRALAEFIAEWTPTPDEVAATSEGERTAPVSSAYKEGRGGRFALPNKQPPTISPTTPRLTRAVTGDAVESNTMLISLFKPSF